MICLVSCTDIFRCMLSVMYVHIVLHNIIMPMTCFGSCRCLLSGILYIIHYNYMRSYVPGVLKICAIFNACIVNLCLLLYYILLYVQIMASDLCQFNLLLDYTYQWGPGVCYNVTYRKFCKYMHHRVPVVLYSRDWPGFIWLPTKMHSHVTTFKISFLEN